MFNTMYITNYLNITNCVLLSVASLTYQQNYIKNLIRTLHFQGSGMNQSKYQKTLGETP